MFLYLTVEKVSASIEGRFIIDVYQLGTGTTTNNGITQ
jgi:fumarate hydratase class II